MLNIRFPKVFNENDRQSEYAIFLTSKNSSLNSSIKGCRNIKELKIMSYNKRLDITQNITILKNWISKMTSIWNLLFKITIINDPTQNET